MSFRIALGILLWPIVACVVVLGDYKHLLQVPGRFSVVIDSWLPCLAVALAAALATVVFTMALILSPTNWVMMSQPTGMGAMLLRRLAWTGAEVYTGIMLARCLGVYFHHYGHRLFDDRTDDMD